MLMPNFVGTDLLQGLHFLFVIANIGEFERLNIFRIEMLIGHVADGNLHFLQYMSG